MALRRRRALQVLLVLALIATSGIGVGCAISGPRWNGPVTDHFDGTCFSTPGAPPKAGFGALVQWQLKRERTAWGARRDEPAGPPPPREVARGQLRVTFINHATTLIQLDGVNVLTDPIYSERSSPFQFAGPARVRPPGIRFEDLPRIDAVVISHNHYDHLDAATLQRIGEMWPKVRVFTGLGNKPYLESLGLLHVTELDWWDTRDLSGVTVRSVPNQHFSNRGLFDSDGTLWCAWVLEGAGGRAYFAGDTAYGPHFAMAAKRLGPMRLAVLPVGAYKPEWFMSPIHMSPAQAVQAALDLGATLAVPIHYGTFPLADDGEIEPIDALNTALAQKPAPFAVLAFGEGRAVPEVR